MQRLIGRAQVEKYRREQQILKQYRAQQTAPLKKEKHEQHQRNGDLLFQDDEDRGQSRRIDICHPRDGGMKHSRKPEGMRAKGQVHRQPAGKNRRGEHPRCARFIAVSNSVKAAEDGKYQEREGQVKIFLREAQNAQRRRPIVEQWVDRRVASKGQHERDTEQSDDYDALFYSRRPEPAKYSQNAKDTDVVTEQERHPVREQQSNANRERRVGLECRQEEADQAGWLQGPGKHFAHRNRLIAARLHGKLSRRQELHHAETRNDKARTQENRACVKKARDLLLTPKSERVKHNQSQRK